MIFLLKYAADCCWLPKWATYSLDNSFSSGKFTTVKVAILKRSEMWWGQHHRVKEIKALHDFYYLIFSKYDDSPNYVVVLAETRSRLERKDLTTMEDPSRVIQWRIIVALMMKIWSQDYSQSSGYIGGNPLITLNHIATNSSTAKCYLCIWQK